MNLLIINDEELTADTMKSDMAWEKYGIDEVYTAYDAEQARKILLEKPVDILLCDIEMPGDNGIELLRWVREQKLPAECIFLTCHASFEYAKEAIALNCQDYILVPAEYEDIGAGVRKVVDRVRAERENSEYAEYGRSVMEDQIHKAAQSGGTKKSHKVLAEDIEVYIRTHLGDPQLSVNALGNVFYMHPVHVNRIFKQAHGMSVSQYIIEERMKLAARLLRSGQLSLNAVSEQVGYRGYSNFNNAFKKYYGCNPSEYEKKQNGD